MNNDYTLKCALEFLEKKGLLNQFETEYNIVLESAKLNNEIIIKEDTLYKNFGIL